MIKPLGRKVLIKKVSEDNTTTFGIIVTSMESIPKAIVIDVGQGHYENGILIPISVLPETKVLYMTGREIPVGEYYLIDETDLIAWEE